jgi:hypothetical protein
VISLVSSARPSRAEAQDADAGAAEALFQTGKSLLEQKNYAQACPKLGESYRLDPGTGTLLALALCHEGDGRLASAWGEFAEVVARSRREARPDREDLARKHMAILEARLPMLTISVAPGAQQIDRLEIRRDGIPVGAGSWATPVPVDPGHHHVEATAPGYKPFSLTVTLATDGAKEVVVVPELERALELPEQPTIERERSSGNVLRYAGLAVAGAGVVGIVVGAVFGLHAISLNNDSKGDCDAQSVCGSDAFKSRNDARSAGNVSTIAFVAGGALVAGGGALFLLAKPHATSAAVLRATPLVSGREVGIRLEGAF